MKLFNRLLMVALLLAAMSVLIVPATAQDGELPGPGEGAPIIYPNLGSDIATLNPIISSDGSSTQVINHIYPALIGINPDTIALEAGVPGSLVTGWEISEDGLVYTLTLRNDWNWSDGTPITANDVAYAFEAIASGETDTSLTYILDDIASVTAVDDYTLEVTLNNAACSALNNIAVIPVVPSHVYREQFPTFADMNEAGIVEPGATANAWTWANVRPGEQVTLLADQNYPDAIVGYVVPEGWVYKNVADQTLMVEQFLSGELTYLQSTTADRVDEIRELGDAGEIQVYEAPSITARFIAFNQADPENPQPGLDDSGNAIDQGFHPILGDVRVRQALMHAMDWDALNEGAMNGEGLEMASHVLPTSWAYDENLPFYEYDPELAAQLLDEAGFVDDDGDPSTPRVATEDALYAEPGTPLSIVLQTNAGNEENENIGLLLTDQWGQSGIEIDFQPIDFNILVEELTGQTFDAVLLFWQFAVPDEPNTGVRANFDPANDVPGSGFNVTSYNNPEVNALLDEANSVEGCDEATRAELYSQVFQILRDEAPWAWIGASIVTSAAQGDVINFDPRPGGALWNEDAWAIFTDN
ncbi:MAG: ABC transporter substrate-binding protein [bacterium]|nr:ABC transporter substrate-binding protein [bacterium]